MHTTVPRQNQQNQRAETGGHQQTQISAERNVPAGAQGKRLSFRAEGALRALNMVCGCTYQGQPTSRLPTPPSSSGADAGRSEGNPHVPSEVIALTNANAAKQAAAPDAWGPRPSALRSGMLP